MSFWSWHAQSGQPSSKAYAVAALDRNYTHTRLRNAKQRLDESPGERYNNRWEYKNACRSKTSFSLNRHFLRPHFRPKPFPLGILARRQAQGRTYIWYARAEFLSASKSAEFAPPLQKNKILHHLRVCFCALSCVCICKKEGESAGECYVCTVLFLSRDWCKIYQASYKCIRS
jgi:hypothetical protein